MAAGDVIFTNGVLQYRDASNVLRSPTSFASSKVSGSPTTFPSASGYAEGDVLLYRGTFDRGSGNESGIILLIKYGTVWRYYAFTGPLYADTNYPNVANTGALFIAGVSLCLQYGGQRYIAVT